METLAADGLASPPLDGRRRHVHYTHCRTNSVSDVQPDQITREKQYEVQLEAILWAAFGTIHPTADAVRVSAPAISDVVVCWWMCALNPQLPK